MGEMEYTGTGTGGSSLSKPAVSLTFDANPQMVVIVPVGSPVPAAVLVFDYDAEFTFYTYYQTDSVGNNKGKYISETKTLNFYSVTSVSNDVGYTRALNGAGITYKVKYFY